MRPQMPRRWRTHRACRSRCAQHPAERACDPGPGSPIAKRPIAADRSRCLRYHSSTSYRFETALVLQRRSTDESIDRFPAITLAGLSATAGAERETPQPQHTPLRKSSSALAATHGQSQPRQARAGSASRAAARGMAAAPGEALRLTRPRLAASTSGSKKQVDQVNPPVTNTPPFDAKSAGPQGRRGQHPGSAAAIWPATSGSRRFLSPADAGFTRIDDA